MDKIIRNLWYNGTAEEAVELFPDSRITSVERTKAATLVSRKGEAIMVHFTLVGRQRTVINGSPAFKLSEAISLQVMCENQQEVDHYWND